MGFGQEFVIFALDNLVALFVYFIFFPMLLCGQVGFFTQVRSIELIDVLRTENINTAMIMTVVNTLINV